MFIERDYDGVPTEEGSATIKQAFKRFWAVHGEKPLPQHLTQLASDNLLEYYEAVEEFEIEGKA